MSVGLSFKNVYMLPNASNVTRSVTVFSVVFWKLENKGEINRRDNFSSALTKSNVAPIVMYSVATRGPIRSGGVTKSNVVPIVMYSVATRGPIRSGGGRVRSGG